MWPATGEGVGGAGVARRAVDGGWSVVLSKQVDGQTVVAHQHHQIAPLSLSTYCCVFSSNFFF